MTKKLEVARRVVLTTLLGLSLNIFAQGLQFGSQGLTQQDINAVRSGVALGGAGIGLGGTTGITSLMAPGLNGVQGLVQSDAEDAALNADQKTNQSKNKPLLPNEFQKYVLEVTGNSYPLYGADFFDNTQNSSTNLARSPVSDDYVLGAGDQLEIRVWGSTNAETAVTIDRNGQISLPRLGTLKLAGVKASQAQGLIKSMFGRLYKDFDLGV
jgi:hypothetical protein